MKQSSGAPCPLDIENVCDGNMLKLIVAHAHALGVRDESILLPLLSCVAGFLGNAYVKVNDEWNESCALWTAVVARSGSRRSAVLDRLVGYAEAALETSPSEQRLSPDATSPLQLLTDCTECDDGELVRRLALYENLTPTFPADGPRRRRTKRGYDDATCGLSLGGFVRHDDLTRLCTVDRADVFSRLVVSHPADVIFKAGDLKTPMAANTPQISQLLGVLRATHGEPRQYAMTAPAKVTFDDYYDATMARLGDTADDVRYAVLAKAPGQLARLAAAFAALRRALKAVVYREEVTACAGTVAITSDDVDSARLVLDGSLRTKLVIVDDADGQQEMCGEQRSGVKRRASTDSDMCPPSKTATSYDTLVERLQQKAQLEQQQKTQYMLLQQQQQQKQHEQRQLLQQEQKLKQQQLQQLRLQQQKQQQQQQQRQQHEQQEQLLLLQQMTGRQPSDVKHPLPPFSHSFNVPPLPLDRRPSLTGVGAPCSPQGGDVISIAGATYAPDTPPGTVTVSMMQLQCDAQLSVHLRDASTDPDLASLLVRHSEKVRKLLQFPLCSKISPSMCSQRHLMPPIDRKEMARLDMHTRYPVAVAKEYLSMVSRLGFGTIEQPHSPASARRSIMYFQKMQYDLLGDDARELLTRLDITAGCYMAGFSGTMPSRSSVAPIDVFPESPPKYSPIDQLFGQPMGDESPMSQAVFPKEEPSFDVISDDSAA